MMKNKEFTSSLSFTHAVSISLLYLEEILNNSNLIEITDRNDILNFYNSLLEEGSNQNLSLSLNINSDLKLIDYYHYFSIEKKKLFSENIELLNVNLIMEEITFKNLIQFLRTTFKIFSTMMQDERYLQNEGNIDFLLIFKLNPTTILICHPLFSSSEEVPYRLLFINGEKIDELILSNLFSSSFPDEYIEDFNFLKKKFSFNQFSSNTAIQILPVLLIRTNKNENDVFDFILDYHEELKHFSSMYLESIQIHKKRKDLSRKLHQLKYNLAKENVIINCNLFTHEIEEEEKRREEDRLETLGNNLSTIHEDLSIYNDQEEVEKLRYNIEESLPSSPVHSNLPVQPILPSSPIFSSSPTSSKRENLEQEENFINPPLSLNNSPVSKIKQNSIIPSLSDSINSSLLKSVNEENFEDYTSRAYNLIRNKALLDVSLDQTQDNLELFKPSIQKVEESKYQESSRPFSSKRENIENNYIKSEEDYITDSTRISRPNTASISRPSTSRGGYETKETETIPHGSRPSTSRGGFETKETEVREVLDPQISHPFSSKNYNSSVAEFPNQSPTLSSQQFFEHNKIDNDEIEEENFKNIPLPNSETSFSSRVDQYNEIKKKEIQNELKHDIKTIEPQEEEEDIVQMLTSHGSRPPSASTKNYPITNNHPEEFREVFPTPDISHPSLLTSREINNEEGLDHLTSSPRIYGSIEGVSKGLTSRPSTSERGSSHDRIDIQNQNNYFSRPTTSLSQREIESVKDVHPSTSINSPYVKKQVEDYETSRPLTSNSQSSISYLSHIVQESNNKADNLLHQANLLEKNYDEILVKDYYNKVSPQFLEVNQPENIPRPLSTSSIASTISGNSFSNFNNENTSNTKSLFTSFVEKQNEINKYLSNQDFLSCNYKIKISKILNQLVDSNSLPNPSTKLISALSSIEAPKSVENQILRQVSDKNFPIIETKQMLPPPPSNFSLLDQHKNAFSFPPNLPIENTLVYVNPEQVKKQDVKMRSTGSSIPQSKKPSKSIIPANAQLEEEIPQVSNHPTPSLDFIPINQANQLDSHQPKSPKGIVWDINNTMKPRSASAPRVRLQQPSNQEAPRSVSRGASTSSSKLSNYFQTKNAVLNVCLAGGAHEQQRRLVLILLDYYSSSATSNAHHDPLFDPKQTPGIFVEYQNRISQFVLLFTKSKSLSYKGLYILTPDTKLLLKVSGKGPVSLSPSEYNIISSSDKVREVNRENNFSSNNSVVSSSSSSNTNLIKEYMKFETSTKSFKSLPVKTLSSTVDAIIMEPSKIVKHPTF